MRLPEVLEAFRGGEWPFGAQQQRRAAIASVNKDGGRPGPEVVTVPGARVDSQMHVYAAAESRCTAHVQTQTGFASFAQRGR